MGDGCETDSFFVQLRKVGLSTERGVAELVADFDKKNTNRCPSKAVMKLADLKKEVKAQKVEARSKLEHIHQTGHAFDEFLGLCSSLLTKHQHKVQEIESFMEQYGYTPQVKPVEQSEVLQDNDDTETTDSQDDVVTVNVTPPSSRPEDSSVSKTPKTPPMEHARLLYKTNAPAGVPTTTHSSVASSVPPSIRGRIPTIFENDGLLVTPSLMGDGKSLQSPGVYHRDQFGSPYTVWTPAKTDMPSQQKIPLMDLNSLASPEIQTPSMRRLVQKTSLKHPDVQALSKAVSEKMMACSPATPVFQTPNLKNLLKKNPGSAHKLYLGPSAGGNRGPTPAGFEEDSGNRTPPVSSRIYTSTETPKTPEMTVNLTRFIDTTETFSYQPAAMSGHGNMCDLSGVPTSYKLSSLQSDMKTPESPELTHNFQSFRGLSSFTVPKFESLAERLGQNKANETPPTPDMLTQKIDQLMANNRAAVKPSLLTSDSVLDSPQLTGTYNFRSTYTSKENVPPRY